MSQSDVSQAILEKDIKSGRADKDQGFFGNYSGLALRISQDLDILAENPRAKGFAAMLRAGNLSALQSLVKDSLDTSSIVEGILSIPRENGKETLEVTILPENQTKNFIILARNRRSEELLSDIIFSIRNELDPQKILTLAAIEITQILGVEGCRISRQTEVGLITVSEYGGAKNLNKFLKEIESEKVISKEAGRWRILSVATRYRNQLNGAMTIWKSIKSDPWEDDFIVLIPKIADQLGIVIEQVTTQKKILLLSRTDSLTGLLNRRSFIEEELPRRIARLRRNKESAALFYADLDNFKLVNDVHGHRAGDDAILKLRSVLMDLSRPGDVIARLGGDEFAMWLDGVNSEVAEARARKLIHKSLIMRELSGARDQPLGVSVGVAMFDPSSSESLDQLIARADAAMYVIKKTGKSGFKMALD